MMNSIFRGIALGVCTFGVCFSVACGGSSADVVPPVAPVEKTEYEKAINDIEKLTKDQRCALEATHYCLEIASLLKEDIYPNGQLDRFTLELQFRKIVDEDYKFLNLQEGTVKLLKDVVERIKDLRIEKGDRELLDELYEQEKKWALFRCLPANMAVLVSADWKQLIANAAQTLLFSAINYVKIRKEIELTHRKESWELDKKAIENETKYFQRRIQTLFEVCDRNKVEPVKEEAMAELIKRFNDVCAETDENQMKKPVSDFRAWLKGHEERYKFCSTYWYYRGLLASKIYMEDKKTNNLQEARGCFDVYQKLTELSILERNPIAIEIAQKQIVLMLEEIKGSSVDKKNREKILEQLTIIRDNLSDKSPNRQAVRIFCGDVYFCVLKDYTNAAVMFKNAEESSITIKHKKAVEAFSRCIKKGGRADEFKGSSKQEREEWSNGWKKCHESKIYPIGNFAAEDENDNLHFLPKQDVEFFARMAYYESLIKAGKDVKKGFFLVDEIAKNEANWPYISPLEFLFYAANVKEVPTKRKYYEEILPRVLLNENKYNCSKYFEGFPGWKNAPVAERPLPYDLKFLRYDSNMWPWTDRYILKMPYQYALLADVRFSMDLMRDETVLFKVPCEGASIEKDRSDKMFLCLVFPIDQKELIERGIDGIRFNFEYRYFKANISFDLKGKLTEKKDKTVYENLPGHISLKAGAVPKPEL